MKYVLVVDDDNITLMMVSHALTDTYRVATATSGAEAIKLLDTEIPDLILMDVEMPEMNGMEAAKLIKANSSWEQIPLIFLTADSDPVTEAACLKLGADDFIIKPVVPLVMTSRISRILELKELRDELKTQLEKKTKQVEMVTLNSIMSIANTIDAKDKYTSGHSVRVANCAVEIAKKLGWSESEIQNFRYVALLHDIGKIGVPDSVLNKPAKLTDEEFAIIKKHPVTGGEILKDIRMIDHVQEGALFHHERYDGKGYPFGLKGIDIPLYARIVCIADSYDAMTSNRIYRNKLTQEQVIDEFEKGSGTQFDPNLAAIFIDMLKNGFSVPYSEELSDSDLITESSVLLSRVLTEYTTEIKQKTMVDSLTGLYNRNYAQNRIGELLSSGHKGTLFMIDLDNFKQINDTYGHIVGDKTLQLFAEILRKNSRDNDVLCRLGGDEFVAFYTDMTEKENALHKAQNILNMFCDRTMRIGYSNAATVSIGISQYPDDGKDFQTLYQNADKSLYYIKNNGKNSYHLFQEDQVVSEKYNTNADLNNVRQMIEEDMNDASGSLQVAYDEFRKIYDFISRYVKRNHQLVQTLLFTLRGSDNGYPDASSLENAIDALKTSVITSLRASDVGTKYSSSQYIVILMDTNLDNGKMVAQRVVEKFHDIYTDSDIVLTYDIQAMQPQIISKEI